MNDPHRMWLWWHYQSRQQVILLQDNVKENRFHEDYVKIPKTSRKQLTEITDDVNVSSVQSKQEISSCLYE